MAKQVKSSDVPKWLQDLGGVVVSSKFGNIKLNSEERSGRYFVGVLEQLPKEKKIKGFKKLADVAIFTELSSLSGKPLGKVEVLCQAGLVQKLSCCKKGDTIVIKESGTVKLKGQRNPMITWDVWIVSGKFTGIPS